MALKEYRILSIQSHVVSGYVGNKSATFPLQVLGFDIDAVNSVQFSNHSGYGFFKGQVLTENDLGDLIEGLTANKLDLSYTHLLTGYIGSACFLLKVAEIVKHLKNVSPSLTYLCDPVMGDEGRGMYVPKELLPIYRDTIVPLADIITPNQYEVELLTNRPLKSVSDAWAAVQWFHEKGVKTVAISSSSLGPSKCLLGFASSTIGGVKKQAIVEVPLLDHRFTGTGDLFAALFLAWMGKTDGNMVVALEKAMSTIHAVLKRTLDYAKAKACGNGRFCRADLELRLIQSKQDIEDGVVTLRAKVVTQ